jgi:Rho GTPase-activating protein 39
MSSSGLTGSAARQYQMQRKGSFDGNSDDSMHEKYFKSVENTPVSRRRHTTTSKPNATAAPVTHISKHSSDSSPQSPVSPKTSANSSLKPVRPSALPMDSTTNYKSSQKSDPDHFNMDVTSKPER